MYIIYGYILLYNVLYNCILLATSIYTIWVAIRVVPGGRVYRAAAAGEVYAWPVLPAAYGHPPGALEARLLQRRATAADLAGLRAPRSDMNQDPFVSILRRKTSLRL